MSTAIGILLFITLFTVSESVIKPDGKAVLITGKFEVKGLSFLYNTFVCFCLNGKAVTQDRATFWPKLSMPWVLKCTPLY